MLRDRATGVHERLRGPASGSRIQKRTTEGRPGVERGAWPDRVAGRRDFDRRPTGGCNRLLFHAAGHCPQRHLDHRRFRSVCAQNLTSAQPQASILGLTGGNDMTALAGKVAIVAGATRGAGRGIACMLGEAGAIVYCTGRSVRGKSATAGRPETIEETAEMVTARSGVGISVQVDHSDEAQVATLFERVEAEQGRLDVLVTDIWGGDELSEWGKPFWELSLRKGLLMQEQGVDTHIITAHYGAPRLIRQGHGIIIEIP